MIILMSCVLLINLLFIFFTISCIIQERKNIILKVEKITKEMNIYRSHVKKDIQVWVCGTDELRKGFKKFEETYIHHMSQVHERLKQLEEPLELNLRINKDDNE